MKCQQCNNPKGILTTDETGVFIGFFCRNCLKERKEEKEKEE